MEELREDFFSIELFPDFDTLDIHKNNRMHCFFIVQRPFEDTAASELLTNLIVKGCRDFVFWGAEEKSWHSACDIADMNANPDVEEDIALTTSYDDIFAFASELNFNLEIEDASEPYYLFYDDAEAYTKVVAKLWHYRLPHKYPKRYLALTVEPAQGITPEEIVASLAVDNSEQNLARAMAIANNKAGWLGGELDETTGERYIALRARFNTWSTLERELYGRIRSILQAENDAGIASHVLGEFGSYIESLPFMERNGYMDGSGWWIECECGVQGGSI